MTKLYVVKIVQSMLVNNSHLCSQSQHEHTHAKNHQYVEWIWIDKNELMQMMWYPWPGDTTLTKTICRKYTVWFFNKGSSLRCFADSAIRQFIVCWRVRSSSSKIRGKYFNMIFVSTDYMKWKWSFSLWYLPGHPFSLHDLDRALSPSQSAPPNAGAGLVHDRRDNWIPPPHDTEHGSQSLHSVHLPSTAHSCNITCISEGRILRSWQSE